MSTETAAHPPPRRRRPLSVTDYDRMAEAGILRPGERVELIEGEIIDMSPVGPDHIDIVNALNEALVAATIGRAIVSVQNPVVLPDHSEPEPDLALLRRRGDRHYRRAKPLPGDILLLIEVADTTLRYDGEIKVPLYAASGIPETWLIDVKGETLTRFRTPTGDGYEDAEIVADLRALELAELPDARIDLSALF